MVEKKITPRSSDNLQKAQFVAVDWAWQNEKLNTILRTVAEVGAFGQPGNAVHNALSEMSDPELPQRLAETMDRAINEAGFLSESTAVVPFTPSSSGGKLATFNQELAQRLIKMGERHVCAVDRYVEILDGTHTLKGKAREQKIEERLLHQPNIIRAIERQKEATALIRFTLLTEKLAAGELYVKTGDSTFVAFDEQNAKKSVDGRFYGAAGKSLGDEGDGDDRYDYSGMAKAKIAELKIETVRKTAQAFFEGFELPGLGAEVAVLLPGGQPHAEEVAKKRLGNNGQKEL